MSTFIYILLSTLNFVHAESWRSEYLSHEVNVTATHCNDVQKQVRSGDIVFLDIPSYLFTKVAQTTNSWTSHVGIAFWENETLWVYESTIPISKRTKFCKYTSKGRDGKFEVRRLGNGLTDAQARAAHQVAREQLYIPYHLGFNFDSWRMFCSKFVYEVYRKALGVEIGYFETFADLRKANPDFDITFWKFWYFGKIPWHRKTVTPASQLNDPKLVTVYSDYGN